MLKPLEEVQEVQEEELASNVDLKVIFQENVQLQEEHLEEEEETELALNAEKKDTCQENVQMVAVVKLDLEELLASNVENLDISEETALHLIQTMSDQKQLKSLEIAKLLLEIFHFQLLKNNSHNSSKIAEKSQILDGTRKMENSKEWDGSHSPMRALLKLL